MSEKPSLEQLRDLHAAIVELDKKVLFRESDHEVTDVIQAYSEKYGSGLYDRMELVTEERIQATLDELKPVLEIFPKFRRELLEWQASQDRPFPEGPNTDFEDECTHLRRLLFASSLKDFFLDHRCDDLIVHEDERLDTAFVGATADVYRASILEQGDEVAVAVKVMRNHFGRFVLGLEQGVNLSIASHVDIGPDFHGFHVTDDARLGVIMNISPGFVIGPEDGSQDGKEFYNEGTRTQYRDQLSRLWAIGFDLTRDSGQHMIDSDGNLYLIDFEHLGRLDDQGRKYEEWTQCWVDPKQHFDYARLFPEEN